LKTKLDAFDAMAQQFSKGAQSNNPNPEEPKK
jgi:hypothetical protein